MGVAAHAATKAACAASDGGFSGDALFGLRKGADSSLTLSMTKVREHSLTRAWVAPVVGQADNCATRGCSAGLAYAQVGILRRRTRVFQGSEGTNGRETAT